MNRAAERIVMLDLPSGASRSALRAGLMALHVIPTALPNDRRGRDTVLRDLVNKPASAVFIDISQGGTTSAPTLLQLDAVAPRHACRQRVFLTRLAGGPGMDHVSEADRRWVRQLGFADLFAEFDALDCEGSLRTALDAVAQGLGLAPLTPADLARQARVMNEKRDGDTARATIRSLTGLAAEDLAAVLDLSLAISDRTYHLQTFPRCFIGSEAAAWLARHLQRSTAEAVAVGQALMALGLLVHVTHDHPFLDERLYYRLAWSGAADRLDLGAVLAGLTGDAGGARGVAVADRGHLGRAYACCWVGAQAVDHVVAHHGVTRQDAWIVLHRLMQFGLIEHVTRAKPFIDGPSFYRFAGSSTDRLATRAASA